MFILDLAGVTCQTGAGDIVIPGLLAYIIHILYNIIRVGVPLLLIFFGMLDLGKAVMAQKEDEIKKGQQTFIHRAVAAVLVFLIFYIVQLVVNVVAPDDGSNIWACVDGLINETIN